VRSNAKTTVVGLHSWLVAAAAALFGWLFALLAATIVTEGWALLGGGVFALALATLYARARRLRPLRVAGLAFVHNAGVAGCCLRSSWLSGR
jgi:hypothetical protein